MSVATLAGTITTIRALVGDTGAHRESMIRDERLEGVDGTNKRFTVLYYPIVTVATVPQFELRKTAGATVTVLTYVSGTPTGSEFTVDPDTGIVTVGTAPAANDPIEVLTATYKFFWYTDEAYNEFIVQASIALGFTPNMALTTAALRAAAALVAVPDGMLDALHKMAGHLFNKRRATEYATRFASSSGGQNVNVDVVTTNFRKLADELWDEAIQARDDFYKRRGGREAPAGAVGNYRPIPTYTPRR